MTGTRLYRGLLHLYPRDFRREYGEDMRQLLDLQLRDEHAVRVWGRTALDLALTVPSLRLESVMARPRTLPSAFFLYGAATVASLVLTAVSGAVLGVGSAGLLLAVGFSSLAVLAWRRAHALDTRSPTTTNWWRWLAAGGAGIAACVLVANLNDDELPEGAWVLWMFALLTSMVVAMVGVLLGCLHAFGSRRTASP